MTLPMYLLFIILYVHRSLRPEAGKYSVEEKHSEPEGVDGRDPQARLGFISYGTDTSVRTSVEVGFMIFGLLFNNDVA